MNNKNKTEKNDWSQSLKMNDDEVINDLERSHKVSKLRKALNLTINQYASELEDGLQEQNVNIDIAEWLDGIECEILRIDSKGWQKGKVRLNLTLEFVPESEKLLEVTQTETSESLGFSGARSSLDDIRQMDV